jgi:hypothetical protein
LLTHRYQLITERRHMRTSIKALAASAALATAGMLAFTATPALANATAPHCDTGARQFICSGDYVAGASYTWTVNWTELGTPFSYNQNTAGADLSNNCDAGYSYSVTYSYTVSGTTVNSNTGHFLCNAGDWP